MTVGFTTTTPPGNPSDGATKDFHLCTVLGSRVRRCARLLFKQRRFVCGLASLAAEGGHAADVNQPGRLTMEHRVHQIGRALGIDAPKRIAVVGVKRHQRGAVKHPR